MYVETSLDTKVRLCYHLVITFLHQHCPTLLSFRRPDKAPEKPAWNPQVDRAWHKRQFDRVDNKRRSSSRPRAKPGQDALHAINHRGDLLLHLLLPVQPGAHVRRHLALRLDRGGVPDQVRPAGGGEDGGGGVGQRVRQHDLPQPQQLDVHGRGDGLRQQHSPHILRSHRAPRTKPTPDMR